MASKWALEQRDIQPTPRPHVSSDWDHDARNAPCRCGSGRKYKHCCIDAKRETWDEPARPSFRKMLRAKVKPSPEDRAIADVRVRVAAYRLRRSRATLRHRRGRVVPRIEGPLMRRRRVARIGAMSRRRNRSR